MSRPTFLDRIDRAAPAVFLLPAVLIVLLMSIFPLVLSIYLSMSRLRFEAGKTVLDFVGFDNYAKFLFGNEQSVLIVVVWLDLFGDLNYIFSIGPTGCIGSNDDLCHCGCNYAIFNWFGACNAMYTTTERSPIFQDCIFIAHDDYAGWGRVFISYVG